APEPPFLARACGIAWIADGEQRAERVLAAAGTLDSLPRHAERCEQRVVARGEARLEARVRRSAAAATARRGKGDDVVGRAGSVGRAMTGDPVREKAGLERARSVEEEEDSLAAGVRPIGLGRSSSGSTRLCGRFPTAHPPARLF